MEAIFETERLIVRKWKEDDLKDLYEYASDERVTKFLPFPTHKSIEDAKTRLDYIFEEYAQDNPNNDYAIQLKSTGKVIGAIGMYNYSKNNGGEIEVGYALNFDYHGHGYMTEVLTAFLKHIKKLGITKRIFAKHDVLNEKSGHVLKKCGMTFEKILEKAGSNNFHSDADLAFYSILNENI